MRGSIWMGAAAVALAMPLCGSVRFTTTELPPAITGSSYDAAIATSVDGRCLSGGGVSLSVAGGRLPRGLELKGQTLTGVAREPGIFRLSLRAATECGATVAVFDLMVTGRPILRAVPEELAFEYRVGTAGPKAQNVLVSGTWPNLPYEVQASGAHWLSYRQAQGTTPYEGAGVTGDRVAVRVQPASLAPGVYRATLAFSTWQGANTPEVNITLTVKP